jgi:thiamine monophosphate synthase
VLALGGINKHRDKTVLENGAHGVAMISAIWNSPDIKNESFEYMKFFAGDSHNV